MIVSNASINRFDDMNLLSRPDCQQPMSLVTSETVPLVKYME